MKALIRQSCARPRMLLMSLICSVFCMQAYGQPLSAQLRLRFLPQLDGRTLILSDEGAQPMNDTMHITLMRCYISGIALCRNGKTVWQEPNSYHLLDAELTESLMLQLQIPEGLQYNSLHFNLGIDSAISTSGAHGGDLDPVKGMYWAWQSGYINFKLEGTSPASTARKHQFQFHLGGYQHPFSALQPVRLEVQPADELMVRMDLGRFMSGIDLSKLNSMMIPGPEAVALSQKAAGIFTAIHP